MHGLGVIIKMNHEAHVDYGQPYHKDCHVCQITTPLNYWCVGCSKEMHTYLHVGNELGHFYCYDCATRCVTCNAPTLKVDMVPSDHGFLICLVCDAHRGEAQE